MTTKVCCNLGPTHDKAHHHMHLSSMHCSNSSGHVPYVVNLLCDQIIPCPQMWTCYGGQFLGDILGQSLLAARSPLAEIPFDFRRHLGLTSFALLIGGSTGHMWHRW